MISINSIEFVMKIIFLIMEEYNNVLIICYSGRFVNYVSCNGLITKKVLLKMYKKWSG